MAAPSVQAVEAPRVNAIEISHPSCQFGLRHFEQQMLVAGHRAPSVAYPVEALADSAPHLEARFPAAVRSSEVLGLSEAQLE